MKSTQSFEWPATGAGHEDRRREVRFLCNSSEVRAIAGGRERTISANVVEVSKSGLLLHADEPVPVGTILQIDMGKRIVQGQVRHCDACAGDFYKVGVLVLDILEQS